MEGEDFGFDMLRVDGFFGLVLVLEILGIRVLVVFRCCRRRFISFFFFIIVISRFGSLRSILGFGGCFGRLVF